MNTTVAGRDRRTPTPEHHPLTGETVMTTTHAPATTEVRIHVDRAEYEGLNFEDTNGEPIAVCFREGWHLFTPWDDDPLVLGGTIDMTDDEVREMARDQLARHGEATAQDDEL